MFWIVLFLGVGATMYGVNRAAEKIFPTEEFVGMFAVIFVALLPLLAPLLILQYAYDETGVSNFYDSLFIDDANPSGYSMKIEEDCPPGKKHQWYALVGLLLKYIPGGIIMILTLFATPVVILGVMSTAVYSVTTKKIANSFITALKGLGVLLIGWIYVVFIGGWLAGWMITNCI